MLFISVSVYSHKPLNNSEQLLGSFCLMLTLKLRFQEIILLPFPTKERMHKVEVSVTINCIKSVRHLN